MRAVGGLWLLGWGRWEASLSLAQPFVARAPCSSSSQGQGAVSSPPVLVATSASVDGTFCCFWDLQSTGEPPSLTPAHPRGLWTL